MSAVVAPLVGAPAREQRYRLFWPWVALTLVCLAWMWVAPGEEVVPFHLIWMGFALAYGFEPWPVRLTCLSLAIATVAWAIVLSAIRAANDTLACPAASVANEASAGCWSNATRSESSWPFAETASAGPSVAWPATWSFSRDAAACLSSS